MCMFKLSMLTTRIKLQLLDVIWKWALLGVFLYNVAGNITAAGVLVAICGFFLILNVRVVLKPLSYPISTEILVESPETP